MADRRGAKRKIETNVDDLEEEEEEDSVLEESFEVERIVDYDENKVYV